MYSSRVNTELSTGSTIASSLDTHIVISYKLWENLHLIPTASVPEELIRVTIIAAYDDKVNESCFVHQVRGKPKPGLTPPRSLEVTTRTQIRYTAEMPVSIGHWAIVEKKLK